MIPDIGDMHLNSQDIDLRIEELKADEELDTCDMDALAVWQAMRNNVGGDWSYGVNFIHEDAFKEHAQDLAEELHGRAATSSWPFSCIDWEQAANELRQDYSVVEVDGHTYYYRA